MHEEIIERLAELAVTFGANVQPGQTVAISGEIGKEPLVRALAASAYRHGAKFVDATYFDPHVKRARIEHAADETLDFVPSWYGERVLEIGRQRCATISLSGPTAPGLLDGLDPTRIGRDQLPFVKEANTVVNERQLNWTAVPCPTPGWAAIVHPELEPEAALARLWEQIAHVCRLDEPDPVAAWEARFATLTTVSERLTATRFDALRFEGPGTDLTVGLLPSSRWLCAQFTTVDGIRHSPNLPSEETFTSPDPRRVEGTVRATKPLVLGGGSIVRGLTVRFEGGRAVAIDAETGADVVRAMCARDEGAARLGEVALVDRAGRVGGLDTVFYDTLLDENVASHIAFGNAYRMTLDGADVEAANASAIHVDFMIGGDEVAVDGVTAAGERVPVMRGGEWQL